MCRKRRLERAETGGRSARSLLRWVSSLEDRVRVLAIRFVRRVRGEDSAGLLLSSALWRVQA